MAVAAEGLPIRDPMTRLMACCRSYALENMQKYAMKDLHGGLTYAYTNLLTSSLTNKLVGGTRPSIRACQEMVTVLNSWSNSD